MSDDVLDIIQDKTTARDMISAMKNNYESKGLASRVDLQRKLSNLSMKDGSNLQDFLKEFEVTL